MKKIICLLLALTLLLCGCGAGNTDTPADPSADPSTGATTEEATTEESTTEETTEPETEPPTEPPTEPQLNYENPLTGEKLSAPVETRIFAVTINNISKALPHYGVSQADLFFEMFINDYATRGLALYSDIRQVSDIGSVRSVRYNFTDIAQGYDAVLAYSGGSDKVLKDLNKSGVDTVYVESEKGDYYYRDASRKSAGYATEHCLFVRGPELMTYAESKGITVTQSADKTYGMTFAEESSAATGEDAATVKITFLLKGKSKGTTMVYDEELGLYVYNQYRKEMTDPIYEQKEGFRNVIVVFCNVTNQGVYHVADLVGDGKGYFACDGKIIPILWSRESEDDVFHYTLEDGTPLVQGIGSSYISLVPLKSTVTW